jgi:hypothetical protein
VHDVGHAEHATPHLLIEREQHLCLSDQQTAAKMASEEEQVTTMVNPKQASAGKSNPSA